MEFNFGLPVQLILRGVRNKLVLAATVGYNKDTNSLKGASLGQGVDVYPYPLVNLTAKNYTAANQVADQDYVFDRPTIRPFNIPLNDELYSALQIDGHENMFFNKDNIASFAPEIAEMTSVLTSRLEAAVGAVISSVPVNEEITYSGTSKAVRGEDIVSAAQDVALEFDERGVESEGRVLAVGRNIAKNILANKDVLNADKSADEGTALRTNTIGNIAGFTVIPSANIPADSFVAYTKQAFTVVNKAPGKNVSAPYSEVITADGLNLEVRANVIGMGKRNATGLYVGTFFTAANLAPRDAQGVVQDNPRAYRVDFVPGA